MELDSSTCPREDGPDDSLTMSGTDNTLTGSTTSSYNVSGSQSKENDLRDESAPDV